MKNTFLNFLRDESGASAAEYALIIAIVGVGIGAAALVLGNNVTAAVAGAANDVHNCNGDMTGGIPEGTGDSMAFTGQDCEALTAAPAP